MWSSLIAFRTWAAIFAAIAAFLLVGGYTFYQMEAREIHLEQYQNLAAIAEMKSEQIARWRKERLADALRVARGPFLRKNAAAMIQHSDSPALREELQRILQVSRLGDFYSNVYIFNLDGTELLSAEPDQTPMEPATQRAIVAAPTQTGAIISDFFRASNGRIYLDAVAAVRDDEGKPLAVVVLRSDAAADFFPLIQSWPLVSRSAETLLVQREGDHIVFLNDLRHRSKTALTLRDPLTNTERPAVQAALGLRGAFDGKDYRGVEVLADLRGIKGTRWLMVTKVDADEILADASYNAYVISLVVGSFIALAGVLIAYAHRRQQAGIYRQLFESERQQRLVQEQFRITLYSIGDGIVTTDTGGRVREMNRVAETLTGWTEVEARGKPLEEIFRIINQDTRAKVHNPVNTVLREGIIVGLANHTLLIARDGTERAIADSAAPICDENGKTSGVVLVFSDVTEKYKAEAALKKSEQQYRMLFDGMLEGFAVHEIICDDSGKAVDYRFLSVNPAFERITGLRAQDVVGRRVLEVLPTTEPDWIERYGAVALTGQPKNFEQYSRAIDRHFEIAAFSPKHGEFAAIFEDITERKRAEEALRASETRFRSLFQDVPSVAVQSYGFDGIVQYWNHASETLYGYTAEEAVGRNILDLIVPPERHEKGRLVLQQMGETGEPMPFSELSLMRKDGSPLNVISSHAIVEVPGRPRELFCFDIDITEHKKLEAQLLRTQRMESIGTLASGVAHDLNNILAPILLSADLLRNESNPALRETLLDTIETCSQRGANIVNQVITFARGAKGERATLQLRHLIDEITKIIQETFPKNICITNQTSDDLWPVKANPTEMHQVLLNLCINARDAMPEGGVLRLRGTNQEIDQHFADVTPEAKPGQYVVLEITDSGMGISSEIISKIFDPFFTTKDVGKGTGLGLSTVAGIVRSLEGFITLESQKGQGTTFKIFLPPDTGELSKPSPEAVARPQGSGETILVVDDEINVSRSLTSVLEINGYKVLAAPDGVQALSIYQSRAGEIQLVLTDINMPMMSGVELIGELKKMNPKLKFIASSGEATDDSEAKLRASGVEKLLHKPFDAEKLLAVVASTLHPPSDK